MCPVAIRILIMKKLLLVAEDRIFAIDKKWSYNKHGFNLVYTDSGDHAIKTVVNDSSINLVLVDLSFDNGMHACDCASEILLKKNLPIVFLTGIIEDHLIQKCEQIESYGFIEKYSAVSLHVAVIKAALRMHQNRKSYLNKNIFKKNGVVDFLSYKTSRDVIRSHNCSSNAIMEANGVIDFETVFHIDQIQKLQNDFSDATNVASIITLPDGTPVTEPSNFCRLCEEIIRKTEKGLAECIRYNPIFGEKTEDSPVILTCKSGGLWDSGAPICLEGQHIANWLIGQVRNGSYPEEGMREYAKHIGTDDETLIKAFKDVPTMSYEQFAKITRALNTLVDQFFSTAYSNFQQACSIEAMQHNEDLLKEACNQNRILLRELQHRAKNSFALISSMITLVIDTITDEEARSALKAVSYRISAISDLYSLLYTTDLVKEVHLDEYLIKLCRSFEGMTDNICFNYSFDNVITSVRTAIPVGIIVTELVTNAIKHAFPDSCSGSVWIRIIDEQNKIILEISDNGIGYNSGTGQISCDTFGLKFITALVGEIDGKLTMESKNGSMVRIEFDN